jgi:hypothetical protein
MTRIARLRQHLECFAAHAIKAATAKKQERAVYLKTVLKSKNKNYDHFSARAVMNDAVLVTRDEDLRRKVEDVVSVKKPEDVLKEIVYC